MCQDNISNCSTDYVSYCDTENYLPDWPRHNCAKTCGYCDETGSSSTLSIPTKEVVLSPTSTSQSTPPNTDGGILGAYSTAIIIGCTLTVFCVAICILCVVLSRKTRQSKKKQGVNYAIIEESVTVVTSSVSQYDEIEDTAAWTQQSTSGSENTNHRTTENKRHQKKDGRDNGKTETMSKTDSKKLFQTQKNRPNEYDRIHVDRNEDISDTDDVTNTSTFVGEKGRKMWNSYDHVTTRFDQHDPSQYAHIKIEFPNTPELQPLTDSSASIYFILEISDEKS